MTQLSRFRRWGSTWPGVLVEAVVVEAVVVVAVVVAAVAVVVRVVPRIGSADEALDASRRCRHPWPPTPAPHPSTSFG
jgi:uncharacterized membrane-anchored protein